MMISEGSGMQADSMPINSIKPKYPAFEITAMMNPARAAIIFSIIQRESLKQKSEIKNQKSCDQKSCESCVKVYPGKVIPESFLVIFTRMVSASGALTFAGRNMAYWVNNSP